MLQIFSFHCGHYAKENLRPCGTARSSKVATYKVFTPIGAISDRPFVIVDMSGGGFLAVSFYVLTRTGGFTVAAGSSGSETTTSTIFPEPWVVKDAKLLVVVGPVKT